MSLDFSVAGQFPRLVSAVLAIVVELIEEVLALTVPKKLGGYFCLLDHATNTFLIPPTLVGEIMNGKGGKYSEFCVEKAKRTSMLMDMDTDRAHPSDLLLSWESRNPEKQRWGGAVGCGISGYRFVFSFSGLSEMEDEAVMLLVVARLGVLENFIRRVAKVSGNSIITDNLRFTDEGQATISLIASH